MLRKGEDARASDAVSAEEAVKDPYLLEFLDLRDEYSESDLARVYRAGAATSCPSMVNSPKTV
jgi:hypothetical protein